MNGPLLAAHHERRRLRFDLRGTAELQRPFLPGGKQRTICAKWNCTSSRGRRLSSWNEDPHHSSGADCICFRGPFAGGGIVLWRRVGGTTAVSRGRAGGARRG